MSDCAHHDHVPRRRSTRNQLTGQTRAAYLARRLGTALRERRHAARLTQRELAARVGLSQTEISRLERGGGVGSGLDEWAACGATLGLDLAAFFERAAGADAPDDLEHLRRQNLVVALATRGGWTSIPEASLGDDGPWSRSIDVLLGRARRREAAVVKIWDLIPDGGHVMRGLAGKVEALRAKLGPTWRVEGLLIVRGTRRNRRLVRDLRALFDARYPARSTDWLRALGDSDLPMPDASGLVWTDVTGTRLISWRR